MIPLLNASVSATSYSAGMCSRNATRIGFMDSLSQKSVNGVHSRDSLLRRGGARGDASGSLRADFSTTAPTASDRKSPPLLPPFASWSSNASARRRSRSFSSCSMSSCSALHVCRLVTITAERSCMTKNAPHTTTNAYHSNTGHPKPSISR